MHFSGKSVIIFLEKEKEAGVFSQNKMIANINEYEVLEVLDKFDNILNNFCQKYAPCFQCPFSRICDALQGTKWDLEDERQEQDEMDLE